MKCRNCGARVKRSEEICPECGKYIAAENEHVLTHTAPARKEIDCDVLEKAEESVKNIDVLTADTSKPEKFIFKDYLLLPSIIRMGVGILTFVVCVLSMSEARFYIRSSSIGSTAIVIIFAFFCIFNAISSIIQERNCFIEITDDKVFGTIPKGTFDTEDFELNIEDIVAAEKEGFHSKHANPKVQIITAENQITVRASSTHMLSDLADALEKRIQK